MRVSEGPWERRLGLATLHADAERTDPRAREMQGRFERLSASPMRVGRLLESGATVSSFGEGPDGELYLCDHGGGRVSKLVLAGG